MINRFLHALTNRKTLSSNSVFVSDPTFNPALLTPGDNALRTALCLDNTNTDYYLQVYAMLIDAYPDIKSSIEDKVTSYSWKDFSPWCVSCTGAKFLSNGSASGVFTDQAQINLPLGLTYVITHVADDLCQINQVETGMSLSANCIATSDNSNTWLRIDWPATLPFKGVLSLTQPWASGAVITITTTPSQFPYAAAVRAVTQQSYFLQLLLKFQVSALFQNLLSPQDQLVLSLAVIARSNLSAYPDV